MSNDITEMPEEVPVMTLQDTILFPKTMVPLYIFEDKYKALLDHALRSDRFFVLARLDENLNKELVGEEPPCNIAGLGLIRACTKQKDGSAHLILQGLTRIKLLGSTSITPFRKEKIEILFPNKKSQIPDEIFSEKLKPQILELIKEKNELSNNLPDEALKFLETIQDANTFIDLSANAICSLTRDKQKILEANNVRLRYELFADILRSDIVKQKIINKLKDNNGDSFNWN